MSKLKILSSTLADLHTVDSVINCSKHEAINSDNALSFEMYLTSDNKNWINDSNVIGLGGDYYDIAHYRTGANQKGELTASVDCEHISYRLNNPEFDEDYFTATGTPTEILTAILSGTGFTVGTVAFTGSHTYSAQEKKSRRAILVQFTEYLGGELLFTGLTVSILAQRGSSTAKNLTSGRNITIISKDVDKTQRDELGNPITAYECDLIEPIPLALGDVVTLDYDTLGINITLRIVSITTDPYNSENISFSVANIVPTIEDDNYQIKTVTVRKDQFYNNCRIGPEYGFENVLSNNAARSYFRADGFAMQTGDGSGGNWTDGLTVYYDEDKKKYRFRYNGDLSLESTARLDDAIAQTLISAETYANGQVASASIILSAMIDSVEAALTLYAETTAPGVYQSKAELSADVVNIISDAFSIIGSGGTAKIVNGQFFGSRFYAGTPGSALGYTVMTEDGLEVYNSGGQLKLKLGFTSDDLDYPYIQLGAGNDTPNSKGLIKKFTNGLWTGNSAPASVNGSFVPTVGYNGLFFDFTDNKAYVVNGTNKQNIYTGLAIAKFGG